jgi:hypothetical protein
MKLGYIFNLINITYLLLSFLILTKSQLDLSTQTATIAVECSNITSGSGANSTAAKNGANGCAPSTTTPNPDDGDEDGSGEDDDDDEDNQDENEDDDDDDEYVDTFYDDNSRLDYNSTNATNKTNSSQDRKKSTHTVLDNKKVDSSSDLVRLKRSLLYSYDRNSRPLRNTTDAVQVRIGISIAQINNLDEVYQVKNRKKCKQIFFVFTQK